MGLGICIFCMEHSETTLHLFFQCTLFICIWKFFANVFQFTFRRMCNFEKFMIEWVKGQKDNRTLPLFIILEIWKAWNGFVFEGWKANYS